MCLIIKLSNKNTYDAWKFSISLYMEAKKDWKKLLGQNLIPAISDRKIGV